MDRPALKACCFFPITSGGKRTRCDRRLQQSRPPYPFPGWISRKELQKSSMLRECRFGVGFTQHQYHHLDGPTDTKRAALVCSSLNGRPGERIRDKIAVSKQKGMHGRQLCHQQRPERSSSWW